MMLLSSFAEIVRIVIVHRTFLQNSIAALKPNVNTRQLPSRNYKRICEISIGKLCKSEVCASEVCASEVCIPELRGPHLHNQQAISCVIEGFVFVLPQKFYALANSV
jgi:hypothetical protein